MTSYQHYNKILLSKQDLRHVYLQFAEALRAKIQHYLPGSNRQDPLQVQVENILNQHIIEVFELAKYSLVVDGKDLADEKVSIQELLHLQPTEEVVPFDTDLNQSLRSLIEAVEQETTEVTRLRRELPLQARDAYEQLVSTTDDEVTRMFAEAKDVDSSPEPSPDSEALLALLGLTASELREEFLDSIKNLSYLQSELPLHTASIKTLNDTLEFLAEAHETQKRELARLDPKA